MENKTIKDILDEVKSEIDYLPEEAKDSFVTTLIKVLLD